MTYKGVLIQQKVGQALNILFDTRKLVCLGDHVALQARHGVSNTAPRSTEYTGELDYSLTVLRMVSVAIKSVLSPLVYARSSIHVATQQEEEACETLGAVTHDTRGIELMLHTSNKHGMLTVW